MKKYAYLFFALFIVLSACQEDAIESSLDQTTEAEDAVTFTFVYKGKEYQEIYSGENSSIKNDVIRQVLQSKDHSVLVNSKRKNTYTLFDSSEEAKRFFGISTNNINSSCDATRNRSSIVLYKNKNYNGRRISSLPSTLGNDHYRYNIDLNPSTSTIDAYTILDLATAANFDNKTSSVVLRHTQNVCDKKAIVGFYSKKYLAGQSIFIESPHPSNSNSFYTGIGDLSNFFFYDFFGIRYGSTWNDKISSLEFYFADR